MRIIRARSFRTSQKTVVGDRFKKSASTARQQRGSKEQSREDGRTVERVSWREKHWWKVRD